MTAGCNLATSVSPILTAYLTTSYGRSSAFITPGVGAVVLSLLIYSIIWDSPSEVGLDEFNQITPLKSRTAHDTVKNKKMQVKALLLSPFVWVLSTGYLMTLFIKTGIGEWTQLFLMQTVGKSQYDSKCLAEATQNIHS